MELAEVDFFEVSQPSLTGVQNVGISYDDVKLLDEAKAQLKKVFLKSAGKRSEKIRLEKALAKITKSLDDKAGIEKVLNDKRFSKLDVLKDQNWIAEIEQEVADEYVGKKNPASNQSRQRLTEDQKKQLVIEWAKGLKTTVDVKLKDFQNYLASHNQGSNAKQWLKPLGVDAALVPVAKGNPGAGTWFKLEKISWLKKGLN